MSGWACTSSIACGNTVGFRLHSVSLAAFGATQHSNYYSLHLGYEKISITNLLRKLNNMYPFGSNSTALVLSIKTVTGCTDIVSEMNEWMNEWMKNIIHVSLYLADANWGHNIKIKRLKTKIHQWKCWTGALPPWFWGISSHSNVWCTDWVVCSFNTVNPPPEVAKFRWVTETWAYQNCPCTDAGRLFCQCQPIGNGVAHTLLLESWRLRVLTLELLV